MKSEYIKAKNKSQSGSVFVLSACTFLTGAATGCIEEVQLGDTISESIITHSIDSDKESQQDLSPRLEMKDGELYRIFELGLTDTDTSLSIPISNYKYYLEQDFRQHVRKIGRSETLLRSYEILDDQHIKKLAHTITKNCSSDEQKAQLLLNWIRENIEYDFHHTIKTQDGFRFPLEVLFEATGSVQDTCYLYSALCDEVGIETVIVDWGDHYSVGVRGDFSGKSFTYQDVEYYNAETSFMVRNEACALSNIGEIHEGCEEKKKEFILVPQDREIVVCTPGGKEYSFLISKDEYLRHKNMSINRTRSLMKRRSDYLKLVTPENIIVKQLAMRLTEGVLSDKEKAQLLLDWVNTYVVYDKAEPASNKDYHRFPIETLYEGYGDCEDSTYLYVSLCRSLGISVAILDYGSHFCGAVAGSFEGEYAELAEEKWYVAETAGSDHVPIGYKPDFEAQSMRKHALVYVVP